MTTTGEPGFAGRLQISEREWLLVVGILVAQIPDRAVWAFGSRATGLNVKRFSDLDLAIEGRLASAQQAALSEAFDEALINFKVDIIELDLIDSDFRRRIEPDFLLLQRDSSVRAATAQIASR